MKPPVKRAFACTFILVFLLTGVLSVPEDLSSVHNNNFKVQQNDDDLNSVTIIPSANLSNLDWKKFEEKLPQYSEALENYKAPFDIPSRYVYYLAGYDYDDGPIWIVEGGKWNIMEAVVKGQTKELELYFMQMAQRQIKSILTRSTPENPVVKHEVFILDMADLDFAQLAHLPTLTYALTLAGKTFHLIEKYVGEAYIINANFATRTLYNIAKPVWGGIFSKATLYGTNKEVWMPKLLKAFPENSIPSWYGGHKDYKPLKVFVTNNMWESVNWNSKDECKKMFNLYRGRRQVECNGRSSERPDQTNGSTK